MTYKLKSLWLPSFESKVPFPCDLINGFYASRPPEVRPNSCVRAWQVAGTVARWFFIPARLW